jgi:UDPglucose--hexose-1-phosphate uridylyltransferase
LNMTNEERKVFEKTPHRRLNILTGEWVQVSPHRTKRPWQGKEEVKQSGSQKSYDPGCYLCPGNERAGGNKNPDYPSTFVFDNDFSALIPEIEARSLNDDNLLIAQTEPGICRVVCFSPNHHLTLPEMPDEQILEIVHVWADQYRELGEKPFINYVQIFENKGEIMGCSNPHPHGQIWAQKTIPDEPLKELKTQTLYFRDYEKTLLGAYLELELELDERIIVKNDHFVAVVPFWAFWPFETLIISRRAFSNFNEMNDDEKAALADLIKQLTTRYDNLFEVSFPYSAGFHPAPTDGKDHPEWHFHMHFYPPLLRSASIKKFMVGYEMLGNPQRDITPEASADILRGLPDVHYKMHKIKS